MQQKTTLQLYNNRASQISWDPSIVMPGSQVETFPVIMHAKQGGEWTKQETGQWADNTRLKHCFQSLYKNDGSGLARFM